MRGNNKSEFRDVIITFGIGGAAMPIDAYQAVIERVKVMEEKFERTGEVNDLANGLIAIIGLNRYKTHIFELSNNTAARSYNFSYLETVPTVDDSISINP